MRSFKEFMGSLNENKGITYEKLVKRLVRKAIRGKPFFLRRGSGSGAFSAHDIDMVLNVDGVDHPIEIKASMRSQMGGISVGYDYKDKTFNINRDKNSGMDDETIEMIYESIKHRLDDIDEVVKWFIDNDHISHYNGEQGFPLKVSTEAWNRAIEEGIIKNINETIQYTTEFINSHYRAKGVHYMQIGKAGLFYLDENPLDLDIPRLQGDINMEFRPGKSGIKYNKTHDYEYSTVVLRLQGRLTFRGNSPMTLDTENGAREVIQFVEERVEENDRV